MTDEKEFFELGKRMYERLNPPPVDWVETNNSACAILRQVHDMLALASFPPKREWVNLTDDEIKEIIGSWGDTPIKGYTRKLMDQIQDKLKEKNT
jgi:hypothetical protein